MSTVLPYLFAWTYLSVLVALVLVLRDRGRERRTIGEVLVEERDWGALRIAGMAGIAIGMCVAWLGRDIVPATWSFPLLLLVAFVQVYRPDFGDRISGTLGVRVGWYLRDHGDLEEWRLTGDHLRFRLLGIWRAVPVPRPEHESLRARLVELLPDRESRFQD